MLKYLSVLALLANVSFGFTLSDELQNIGNALNSGGAYSNTNQCNVPPGWQKGRKVGFVNGMPPGLAKKGLRKNCQPASNPMGNEKFEHGPHPKAGGLPGKMH